MRWGILGCAGIAINSFIPALLRSKEQKLIVIASRKIEKAKEVAKLFNCDPLEGYESVLERSDIDIVYIPLPNQLHVEWCKKALIKGKHVLIEKPAATNLKEAQELVEIAREKGLAIIENFQFQHHSQHKFVFDLLERKEIGEIRCFRSSFGFPPFKIEENIRYKKDLSGGALLDAGAYVLRVMHFLFDKEFQVEASYMSYNKDFNVDWFGSIFAINKESGISCELSYGFDNYYQCNYEIWGSKGKITSTRAFTAKENFSPSIILEKQGYYEEFVLPPDDHFVNMILYCNKVILNKNFEIEQQAILRQASLIDQVLKKSK